MVQNLYNIIIFASNFSCPLKKNYLKTRVKVFIIQLFSMFPYFNVILWQWIKYWNTLKF
jgi:hypothetical protein